MTNKAEISALWERTTGIVIAADVATLDELRAIAEMVAPVPEVVGIKIGFMLGLRYGLGKVVAAVRDAAAVPVIYDHQKAGTDIPQMGKPFAATCKAAGVQAAIFFPLAGPKTLEGFVTAAIEEGVEPIVGLAMTHPKFLVGEGGYIDNGAPDAICRAAIDLGVGNYVLPGTKTDIVSRFAKGPLAEIEPATIMMPGIGSQGGSIAAAFEAASPHRRFAIIGSAIYNAVDPASALAGFVEEVCQ